MPLLEKADHHFPAPLAALLKAHSGPFLLGCTAPDVRNISPVTRQETHFYPVPPDPDKPSMQTMLRAWPSLADPGRLPVEQAAFVSGYIAHLWFDEFWHHRIIRPYYVDKSDWASRVERFDVYNVLLGYLDAHDRLALNGAIGPAIQATEPNHWLPFVPDQDLRNWRDLLAAQLQPGAGTQTVEIMAQRAHMGTADFAALITDQERMEREIFGRTPRVAVAAAYRDGEKGSADIIRRYLDQNQDAGQSTEKHILG